MTQASHSPKKRFLVLGGGEGWHTTELTRAATARDHRIDFASYESLSTRVGATCDVLVAGESVSAYNAVLARTMPAGSLEAVCFRLASLHDLVRRGIPVVNPPSGLELAIDKFSTLSIAKQLGMPVPESRVIQDRSAAMRAFDELGGDCVVKPIFGGEGRGVMRVQDRELAWTVFHSLQMSQCVMYVQAFVPPGGRDRRVLLIGSHSMGIRRMRRDDFRTNTRGQTNSGDTFSSQRFSPEGQRLARSREIANALGLSIAAVDWIEDDAGQDVLLEVNAIPGWKSAQSVVDSSASDSSVSDSSVSDSRGKTINIADRMIDVLESTT